MGCARFDAIDTGHASSKLAYSSRYSILGTRLCLSSLEQDKVLVVHEHGERLAERDRDPEDDVADLVALQTLGEVHERHLHHHSPEGPQTEGTEGHRDDDLVEDSRDEERQHEGAGLTQTLCKRARARAREQVNTGPLIILESKEADVRAPSKA